MFWVILCLNVRDSHSFCTSSNRLQIIKKKSISPIDRILTGTTAPGLSGPGSNSNEGVPHAPQISRIEASPSDAI